jgi:hypothetical protein
VLNLDYRVAFTAQALDEAIVLEIAGLCAGRTMSEWALYYAAARRY